MSSHSDDLDRPPSQRGPVLPEQRWQDDDALAADLAGAVRETPTADRVAAAAASAFRAHRGMLALRDELAADLLLLTLAHDSSLAGAAAGVRDRTGRPSRTLVFEGDGVGVEVEVTADAVEGQLVPARPGRVVLRGPEGALAAADTDEVGYFRLTVRPEGPARLMCESAEGTCVTPWLTW